MGAAASAGAVGLVVLALRAVTQGINTPVGLLGALAVGALLVARDRFRSVLRARGPSPEESEVLMRVLTDERALQAAPVRLSIETLEFEARSAWWLGEPGSRDVLLVNTECGQFVLLRGEDLRRRLETDAALCRRWRFDVLPETKVVVSAQGHDLEDGMRIDPGRLEAAAPDHPPRAAGLRAWVCQRHELPPLIAAELSRQPLYR
jgi:hypothetical protein